MVQAIEVGLRLNQPGGGIETTTITDAHGRTLLKQHLPAVWAAPTGTTGAQTAKASAVAEADLDPGRQPARRPRSP
ncbi:hypothetical protein [Micromonospora viridifaciens]|uniref:hypothetical protein n=1 Tax=Micromonospora viridifaciens TaxID=1881 RepID=UPI000B5AEEDA|nr:hypothetical protein [Micromonospora viridifaciens]